MDELRPNSWFLDRKKIDNIRGIWQRKEQNSLPDILVAIIEREKALIDGHCRAFVAWENGALEIKSNVVSLDRISGIKDLYIIFHRQGPNVGVKNVMDLGKRIYDLSETSDPDIAVLLEGAKKEN